MWWAINKKTRKQYGPYTDAEKQAFQANPSTNVFDWVAIKRIPPAPTPELVKKVPEKKEAPKGNRRKSPKSDGQN